MTKVNVERRTQWAAASSRLAIRNSDESFLVFSVCFEAFLLFVWAMWDCGLLLLLLVVNKFVKCQEQQTKCILAMEVCVRFFLLLPLLLFSPLLLLFDGSSSSILLLLLFVGGVQDLVFFFLGVFWKFGERQTLSIFFSPQINAQKNNGRLWMNLWWGLMEWRRVTALLGISLGIHKSYKY